MTEDKKDNNWFFISIIAIVAIVGIVAMVTLMKGQSSTTSERLMSQASIKADANMAGNAFRLCRAIEVVREAGSDPDEIRYSWECVDL